MIELQQLVYFIAIAKCGTLSGAAEELNISQPSLSRSMKILENEYFYRN
ncbi:MAG: LysR family transcriptional regulator [Lachnospiraceae bacterium]|nr:LysR family transcriptional regulator [Lachnospiraceae bacterium]